MALGSSGLLTLVAPLATSRIKHAVAANLATLKQLLEGVADVASDNEKLLRNPSDWVAVPQPRIAGDASLSRPRIPLYTRPIGV